MKIPKLKLIRDWFYDSNLADFGDPIENAFLSRLIPPGFVDDKAVQDKVVKYFAAFDSSIIGFNVETIASDDDDDDSKHIKIDAVHRIADSNETATIPLSEESAGTLKMFALYPALQDTLENGGVLFVDELNARLHPLLVRAFLVAFLNPETNLPSWRIWGLAGRWRLSALPCNWCRSVRPDAQCSSCPYPGQGR